MNDSPSLELGLNGTDAGDSRLLPYLANFHTGWLAGEQEVGWRDVQGSLLFADVSGFTPLTERLAKRGKEGAEELTEILNSIFTQLLDAGADLGGDCLKFGGDALLLLFTGDGHAVRGREAGQAMLAALRSFRRLKTSAGTVRLGMSAGLHSGDVLLVVAGERHKELLVVGPVVTETLEREAAAQSGTIDISSAALRFGARDVGVPLVPATRPVMASSGAPLRIAEGLDPIVGRYLGDGPQEGEHRLASIGFIQFGGTDELLANEGPEALWDALQSLMGSAGQACEEHGVTFISSDVDKRAGKLILAAGVPSASADDDDRLLETLRQIVSSGGRLPVRAGANRGRVFAVDLGCPTRRSFTVIGDAVNLTARIMGHAKWGEVLASQAILERARVQFRLIPVEPFAVKGKSGLVQASRLGDVVTAEAGTLSDGMVARRAELSLIRAAIAAAYEGTGGVVELIGDPGIGKSTLASVARDEAGMRTIGGQGGRYSRSTPFFALRRALRSMVSIDATASPTLAAEQLQEKLIRIAPDLAPWAPLIAPAFGTELPDSDESSKIDPSFRAVKARTVIVDLAKRVLTEPTLWHIEDVHWLDSGSSDLLLDLMSGVQRLPWLFLLTRRPQEGGLVAPPYLTLQLRLEPLSDSDAAALVSAAAEQAEVRLLPGTVERLVARSGGNPLFLRELVKAAANPSLTDLPETIEALVAANIDTLRPTERSFLRQAATLGSRFPIAILAQALDLETSRVEAQVRSLHHFLRPTPDGTVAFHHVLLRDVAYEGLAFRTRRRLHSKAADVWESATQGDPEGVAELLSVHFHAAGRYSESWRYSVMAGRKSHRNAAPIEAAEFYQRALEAARHVGGVSSLEQAEIAEALGDVLETSGRYMAARGAYAKARRLDGSVVGVARSHCKTAATWAQEGRYRDSARACRRGMKFLRNADDPRECKELAELDCELGFVLLRQGRYEKAIPILEDAVRLARICGSDATRITLARAYRYLDSLHIEMGLEASEPYREFALELYDEIGDELGRSNVLNNMGVAAYWDGRWDESVVLYERSHEAAGRAGASVFQALLLNNIAEIRSDQGRISEAEELLRESLKICQSASYWGTGVVHANLGRAAARAERFAEAANWYSSALEILRGTGQDALASETKARQAELLLLQGSPAAALDALDAVGTTAASFTLSLADRVAGYALGRLDDLPGGWNRMSRAVLRSRENTDEYATALGLQGLGVLARAMRRHDLAEAFSAEAQGILIKLGVVGTPLFHADLQEPV